jgi:hypothetical protein
MRSKHYTALRKKSIVLCKKLIILRPSESIKRAETPAESRLWARRAFAASCAPGR